MNKNIKEMTNSFLKNFSNIKKGDSKAVIKMLEMWTQDGVFQFDGLPELNGSFHGIMALEVLFTSIARSAASGNEVRGLKKLHMNEMSLGEIRTIGDECYCDWRQVVSREKGQGALIFGNIKLTFRQGLISAVKVVSLPLMSTPDEMLPQGLSMKDINITDIGRLALAAWAVV